jgi:[ribosomal protein S5]-alanine N-acetyltransferase
MLSFIKKALSKKGDQMILYGNQCFLKTFKEGDAAELAALLSRNKYFWSRFEPIHRDEFYTEETQQKKIVESLHMLAAKREYSFGIYDMKSKQLIGHIALYALKRLPYSSAFIGYSLDEKFTRRGIASEAVSVIRQFAFNELKLHRIEAYVAPENIASIKVLENNGFKQEGLLRKLLYINGYWIDHYLYAILDEEFRNVNNF